MIPSSDPKAAPIKRFKVVFRTWISKMTMAIPQAKPAATA